MRSAYSKFVLWRLGNRRKCPISYIAKVETSVQGREDAIFMEEENYIERVRYYHED